MFDFRYHALSLAAVLLALAIGVLLGVAIGDSNLVSSAKTNVVHSLQQSINGVQQHNAALNAQLAQQATFENELIPIAVRGQLTGKRIGLLFLGSTSEQIDGLVRNALTPAGGQLSMVAVIHEPLDLGAIAAAAATTNPPSRYDQLGTTPSLLPEFGRRIGVQLVQGGALIGHVQTSLMSALDGQVGSLGGVVVVHDDPPGLASTDTQALKTFDSALIGAITALGVPVVGVELSTTTPSQIPWYRDLGMSSVDDLDQPAGGAALALALAGNNGTFGIKSTAQSMLPQVVAAPSSP
jgi:hypothetical protein